MVAPAKPVKAKGKGGKLPVSAIANGPGEENALLRQACQELAWGFKVKGYNYREIAIMVAAKLGMETPVAPVTVMRWLDDARSITSKNIARHRDEYIDTAIPRLEMLIKEYLPIAAGQKKVAVARTVMVNGFEVEVIDENAFKEQIKAAELVLKTQEQARRILGVGLAGIDAGGDDKQATVTQINNLLISIVQNNNAKPGDAVGNSAVVLEAGDAVIEGL